MEVAPPGRFLHRVLIRGGWWWKCAFKPGRRGACRAGRYNVSRRVNNRLLQHFIHLPERRSRLILDLDSTVVTDSGRQEGAAVGYNPRYRGKRSYGPRYEELYCARGDMENMLKQQVLDLQADRLSTRHWASNQRRLWLATFGYLLMERLRALGLAGAELAQATAGSVRLNYLLRQRPGLVNTWLLCSVVTA